LPLQSFCLKLLQFQFFCVPFLRYLCLSLSSESCLFSFSSCLLDLTLHLSEIGNLLSSLFGQLLCLSLTVNPSGACWLPLFVYVLYISFGVLFSPSFYFDESAKEVAIEDNPNRPVTRRFESAYLLIAEIHVVFENALCAIPFVEGVWH